MINIHYSKVSSIKTHWNRDPAYTINLIGTDKPRHEVIYLAEDDMQGREG